MSADSYETTDGGYVSATANKLFVTKSGVGISTCGNRTSSGHHIEKYMDEFLASHTTQTVSEVAHELLDFFVEKWEDMDATFHVTGYEQDEAGNKNQKKFRVFTKEREIKECDYTTGAQWNGKYAILNELVSQTYYQEDDGTYKPYEYYKIRWGSMNIQDGIDFCRFMTETTAKMMTFQNRQATVGGPVDILVIKPNEYIWVSKKELR